MQRLTAAVRRLDSTSIALGLCLVIAAALRLASLGYKGLWIDEVDWMDSTAVPTLAEAASAGNFPHSPFLAVMMWPFQALFFSDALARLLPAAMGIATIPLLYAIGARIFTRGVGLTAAAILTLCPIHVDYSRQFEPYAPAVFFLTTTVYLTLRACDHGSIKRWLLAILFAAISAYASIFAICALGLVTTVLALAQCRTQRLTQVFRRWSVYWAFVLAAYLPFFVYSFLYRPRVVGLGTEDRFASFFPPAYGFLDNAQLLFATIWRDDKVEMTIPLLVLLFALATGILSWPRRKPLGVALSIAWASTALLIFCICIVQHYQPAGRYFMMALPGLCLFGGASLHGLFVAPFRNAITRRAIACVSALVFLPLVWWNAGALAAHYVAPPVEDNKFLIQALDALARPDDKIYLSIANPPFVLRRYAPRLVDRSHVVNFGEFPAAILENLSGSNRVLFAYRAPFPAAAQQVIYANGVHTEEFHVRGQNTAIDIFWPKDTAQSTINQDTLEALSTAVQYAGPNAPSALLRLAQFPGAAASVSQEELYEKAVRKIEVTCLANPTDPDSWLLFGDLLSNLKRPAAANAYAASLLVQNGREPSPLLALRLLGALRPENAGSPFIRTALSRVHELSLVSNGSFELKDTTGRPNGWILAPPNAGSGGPLPSVTAQDGDGYMTIQSSDTYWSLLAIPLEVNPNALTSNSLTVNAYGQAPAADTFYLMLEAKSGDKQVVIARQPWPACPGKWTPLTVTIDTLPAFDEGTLRLNFSVRNVPGYTCALDNVSVTLNVGGV